MVSVWIMYEVTQVYAFFALVFAVLELTGLSSTTNVILTSDNGMTATGMNSGKRYSKITEYTDAGNLERVVGNGPFSNVKIKDGVNPEQVLTDLQSWPGMSAYPDQDVPEMYHYSNNELIHDILLISENGTELIESDYLHAEDYLPEPNAPINLIPEHVTGKSSGEFYLINLLFRSNKFPDSQLIGAYLRRKITNY